MKLFVPCTAEISTFEENLYGNSPGNRKFDLLLGESRWYTDNIIQYDRAKDLVYAASSSILLSSLELSDTEVYEP